MPARAFKETLRRELKDPLVAAAFLNDALAVGSPVEIEDAILLVLEANELMVSSSLTVSQAIKLLLRSGITIGSFKVKAKRAV